MDLKLIDDKGQASATVAGSDTLFGRDYNEALIHQIVTAYQANARQGTRARVIRDSKEIYAGNISSLRRFKEDVREVEKGYECGIGIENFNDIKVGDVIECYRTEEVARTLGSAPLA